MRSAPDTSDWGDAGSGRSATPRPLAYSAGLDGLRAAAVVAVFAYHEAVPGLGGGFLGVDVFFVISGFLITSLLLDEHRATGRIDLRAFWARRARRLVPAALLAVVGTVVLAAALDAPSLDGLRGEALAGLLWVTNWHFVLEGVSYFGGAESPLRHLWSLAVEEQFYLTWPLLAWLALRRGRWALRLLVVGGWAASVAAMALLATGSLDRAYFGTDARAHALLLGAGLALARSDAPRLWALARRLGPVSAAVLAGILVLGEDQGAWMYPGGFVLVALASAGTIAAVADPSAPPARWTAPLRSRPVVAVGRVSYGLYLWHWPVIVLLDAGATGLDGPVLVALHVALSAALTVASYHLLECPVRFGQLPRPAMRVATPAVAVGAVLTVMVVAPQATFDSVDRAAPVVDLAPSTSTTGRTTTAPGASATTATTDSTEAEREAAVASASATRVPRSTTTTEPVRPRPRQMVFVGGSVAYTLAPSLGEAFVERGVAFRSATWLGCGVIRGLTTTRDGEQLEWAPTCVDEALPEQDRAIAETDPDVVLWWSQWETSDRLVDGRRARFGTPEGDRVWHQLLVDTIDRFSAHGATVVILAIPPGVGGSEVEVDPAENERIEHLNELLAEAAAARPGAAVLVDPRAAVCGTPSGPCGRVIDGVDLRPEDGGHFSEEGAAVVTPRLADVVLAEFGGPGGG